MKKSIFISLLVSVSVWAYAQSDRVTTLQGARTLVVTDSEGQRDYYQVTTAKPFVIRKEDGQLVLAGKQQRLADVKSLRLEVPQKFQLSEDSTTFTSYNVDRGLLALRRSLRVQTAQAKLSARVVAIMPFLLVAAFSLASPDFLSPFFASPLGIGLLTLAIVMQVAGIILVRRALAVDGVS